MANYSERINKAKARKLYNEGYTVLAIPHKMNPNNQFWGGGIVMDKRTLQQADFDKVCNEAVYYNCDNERGRYLAFYRG